MLGVLWTFVVLQPFAKTLVSNCASGRARSGSSVPLGTSAGSISTAPATARLGLRAILPPPHVCRSRHWIGDGSTAQNRQVAGQTRYCITPAKPSFVLSDHPLNQPQGHRSICSVPHLRKLTMFGHLFLAVAAGAAYLLVLAIHRLWFNPLAKFPGPKLAALSRWYEFYYEVVLRGQFTFHIQDLHKKYGTTVALIARQP